MYSRRRVSSPSPKKKKPVSSPSPLSPKTPARARAKRAFENDVTPPQVRSTTRRMVLEMGISPPMTAGWRYKPSSASENRLKKKKSPVYRKGKTSPKKEEMLPARALFAENELRVKRTVKSPSRRQQEKVV